MSDSASSTSITCILLRPNPPFLFFKIFVSLNFRIGGVLISLGSLPSLLEEVKLDLIVPSQIISNSGNNVPSKTYKAPIYPPVLLSLPPTANGLLIPPPKQPRGKKHKVYEDMFTAEQLKSSTKLK